MGNELLAEAVYYLKDWTPRDEVVHEYKRILGRFPKGVRQVALPDTSLTLIDASGDGGEGLTDTGHRPGSLRQVHGG